MIISIKFKSFASAFSLILMNIQPTDESINLTIS